MAEITMDGMDELLSKLEQLGKKASTIENSALKAGAQPILDDAKSTTAFHDRSGNLREGLKISGVKTKDGIKYVLVGIDKSDNSKIFYGKFIEFGTSKMSARPFLQPALERKEREAMEIIRQKLKEALGM